MSIFNLVSDIPKSTKLYQISAPYYTAGLVIENEKCTLAAPIIKWMIDKEFDVIKEYCNRKKFKIEEIGEQLLAKYYNWEGTVNWAKVYEPETFMGQTKWKLDFYPKDVETWMSFKESGAKTKVKEGENGKFIQLSRKQKNFWKGQEVIVAPPTIKDKDGNTLVGYIESQPGIFDRKGDPVLIGNGSKVRVTVEVYDTQNYGKHSRLVEIQILDLIEYKPEEKKEESKPEQKKSEGKAPWE